uniref:Beta-defensin n=1 Tax=Equus asinus TaxID=9793 RepID=A0A9L0JH73_EQUAS|nr:beta-defensin 43-like [Equus asinus]
MRVLLSILGVFVWLSIAPQARSLFFKEVCRSGYYNCRMKCNADEFAIRYCADWSICCRLKKTELKKKKMW